MYKILFVCTGNICRSPTAEGIMQSLIKNEGLEDKIKIDSAGTHGWHNGEGADLRAVHCAKGFGIDLTYICSRPLVLDDFDSFDLILIMDEANKRDIGNIITRSSNHDDILARLDKVHKILEYAPDWGEDVPDPYYNDRFDEVFMMLQDACQNVLEEVKKHI
ncbi:MAG: low molecular weight phosphotyrosine protein phosphatase [Lactobacillus sp.]|jgi:protein-tyrosine phosphatase|nr:low molecular weight phosphotyrosine protein phosphatase [Lactobacillus sp.]